MKTKYWAVLFVVTLLSTPGTANARGRLALIEWGLARIGIMSPKPSILVRRTEYDLARSISDIGRSRSSIYGYEDALTGMSKFNGQALRHTRSLMLEDDVAMIARSRGGRQLS